MRRMLSTKSGATFNLEAPNMTFAVRKDVIEIVYKVKPGVFQIVNLSRIDVDRGMLFMNWGDYFRRLSNEKAQMPKLQKHCPTLYDILVGEDKDGVKEMDFGRSEEECEHGFGIEVKISGQLPLPLCITPEIVNKAGMMHVKMLKVYNEIVTDVPFPAWKTGLDEVWEP